MIRLTNHPLDTLLLTAFWAACFAAHGAEKLAPAAAKGKGELAALEKVQWRDDQMQSFTIAGRVLIEAQDGGILVLGQDGRLWPVEKPQLVSREEAKEPFRALSSAALGKQLQSELGAGFELVVTKHYVICSSAERQYAQ